MITDSVIERAKDALWDQWALNGEWIEARTETLIDDAVSALHRAGLLRDETS